MIRPIDFNGMIQNTSEVGTVKTQEDSKQTLVQQNVTVVQEQKEQAASSTVQAKDRAEDYGYDREGNGGFYGSDGRKKEKKEKKSMSDGKVMVKNVPKGFDIKI